MFVLGTSGHVDHGKSSFLRVLTGLEPDRLPEEKKRGMTIDLNFVWVDLPPFGKVGIVDVPGHQKFVRNMISGVMNIDAYLFIVAADDGWMPQTEEHWQVLKGFGVSHGLGVVTKTDLVSAERVKEVEGMVRRRLAELGPVADVIPFSIQNAQPEPLRAAVEKLVKKLSPPAKTRGPRLWVDRVFVPKGMGVVVTGTLREGELKVGDEVLLSPGKRTAKVKGLQSYHESHDVLGPVSRVAVQLGKVAVDEISRGVLLTVDPVELYDRFEAATTFYHSPPKRSFTAQFFTGTTHSAVKVSFLEGKTKGRLKLERKCPLRVGDPFLLRTHGDEYLLATGRVTALGEPKKKAPPQTPIIKTSTVAPAFWAQVQKALTAGKGTPVPLKENRKDLLPLIQAGEIISLGEDHYLLRNQWETWKKKIVELLKAKTALSTGDFKEALGLSRKYAVMILEKSDSERVTYLKDAVRRLLKSPG